MEIGVGVFGSPGNDLFLTAILFGILGLFFLAVSILTVFSEKDSRKDSRAFAGVFGILALIFLVSSMVLLPIGNGKQRVGDCFDRLPEGSFPVDSAFPYDDGNVLYIVVLGKNDDDKVVRECATVPMSTVEDYPDRPVSPGEYRVVVKDHKVSGAEWTTNRFVPAKAK